MDPYEDVGVKAGDNSDPKTPWEDLATDLPLPGETGDSEHGLDTAAPNDAVAETTEEEPSGLEDERTEVNEYGEGAQA